MSSLNIGDLSFEAGSEFTARTQRIVNEYSLTDSELIFVGYGINAPEYNWNDYAGLDVKGKTVVMLVNDPGFASKDPNLFQGNAMTYYGRWTYKYEEAARQGAEAVFIVHETMPAGYGWGVSALPRAHSVSGGRLGPQLGNLEQRYGAGRAHV